MELGSCESCGEVDCDDLIALHRLYVTPEAWDTEGSVTKVPEVERWCAACRANYPHVPVGVELDAQTPGAQTNDADTPEG